MRTLHHRNHPTIKLPTTTTLTMNPPPHTTAPSLLPTAPMASQPPTLAYRPLLPSANNLASLSAIVTVTPAALLPTHPRRSHPGDKPRPTLAVSPQSPHPQISHAHPRRRRRRRLHRAITQPPPRIHAYRTPLLHTGAALGRVTQPHLCHTMVAMRIIMAAMRIIMAAITHPTPIPNPIPISTLLLLLLLSPSPLPVLLLRAPMASWLLRRMRASVALGEEADDVVSTFGVGMMMVL